MNSFLLNHKLVIADNFTNVTDCWSLLRDVTTGPSYLKSVGVFIRICKDLHSRIINITVHVNEVGIIRLFLVFTSLLILLGDYKYIVQNKNMSISFCP